jgi:hypothetical protein
MNIKWCLYALLMMGGAHMDLEVVPNGPLCFYRLSVS